MLQISHVTRYDYGGPVSLGLLRLRLRPAPVPSQRVLRWDVSTQGLRDEARFTDAHGNDVRLVSVEPGARRVEIVAEGEAEALRADGVLGPHEGPPLWLYRRATSLTRAGAAVREVAQALEPGDPLASLHRLSDTIRTRMPWTVGATDAGTDGETALGQGAGVCQDHAHAFIAACRARGVPARYVSGYLLIEGQEEQEAAHAWAEAHVESLGWTGFDISNGHAPDARYMRLGCGLDYRDAAPVTGILRASMERVERLTVSLRVRQATQTQQ